MIQCYLFRRSAILVFKPKQLPNSFLKILRGLLLGKFASYKQLLNNFPIGKTVNIIKRPTKSKVIRIYLIKKFHF